MYAENLPTKIIAGEEIKEDENPRLHYLKEKRRLKGFRIHYHEHLYLYVFEAGFKSGKGVTLTLLDKYRYDEHDDIDDDLPLEGINLVELVETNEGYVKFNLCYLEIKEFYDYLLFDFERFLKIICEVAKSLSKSFYFD